MDLDKRKEDFKIELKELLEKHDVQILLVDTSTQPYESIYEICACFLFDGEGFGDEIMGTYMSKDTL